MAIIEKKTRLVYFSPTARRHFLTKKAAILAEARVIILRKHPSEDNFSWRLDLKRSDVLYRRLTRIIKRQQPSAIAAGGDKT